MRLAEKEYIFVGNISDSCPQNSPGILLAYWEATAQRQMAFSKVLGAEGISAASACIEGPIAALSGQLFEPTAIWDTACIYHVSIFVCQAPNQTALCGELA